MTIADAIEAGKAKYLKREGMIKQAGDAIDLEDHREVMAINREMIKNQGQRLNSDGTVERFKMEPELDEMHVGDVTNNYLPTQQPNSSSNSGGLASILKGLAGPLLAAAATAGAIKYFDSPGTPEPDFVNMPSVNVTAPTEPWTPENENP